MAIVKIRSAALAPNDWVEVGSRIVYAGTYCKVTGIEAGDEGYTVRMLEDGPVTYDSQAAVRPIFAVNAMAPVAPALHSVIVTDVVAIEEVEDEEESGEPAGDEVTGE